MSEGAKRHNAHSNLDDLTGRTFFCWLVVSRGKNDAQGKPQWVCRCECGSEKEVRAAPLRSGASKSCGCKRAELWLPSVVRHGQSDTVEYSTWRRIKQRCYDTGRGSFLHYGGRGISVCDRWLCSFENFFEDMGPRPGAGFSIERIDSNADYSPGNCKWATIAEQNRNKRSNVSIELQGRTQLAADWAREFGISQGCLRYRVAKGIPLTLPVRKWK